MVIVKSPRSRAMRLSSTFPRAAKTLAVTSFTMPLRSRPKDVTTYRDTAPCAGLRARAAYDADGVVVAASVSSGRGNGAFADGAARDAREARSGSDRAMRAIASGSTARDMARSRSNARAVRVGVRRTRPERRRGRRAAVGGHRQSTS